MNGQHAENLISESLNYGFALFFLTVTNVAFASFIYFIWKQSIKEKKELIDVIKENTAAFTSLQSTINTLIQIFSKSKM